MKSNRGVTVTSLVIYIICLTIVISWMGVISNHFYQSINESTIRGNDDEQYSRFLAYLTKDVNSDNLIYVKAENDGGDNIIFKFDNQVEHQYILSDGAIYYINIENNNEKKILLCEDVSSNKAFIYSNNKIDVNFRINKKIYSISFNIKNI